VLYYRERDGRFLYEGMCEGGHSIRRFAKAPTSELPDVDLSAPPPAPPRKPRAPRPSASSSAIASRGRATATIHIDDMDDEDVRAPDEQDAMLGVPESPPVFSTKRAKQATPGSHAKPQARRRQRNSTEPLGSVQLF
jgi:hypothetical protein